MAGTATANLRRTPPTATTAQSSPKKMKVRRVPMSGIRASAEAKVPARLPAVEIAYMRPATDPLSSTVLTASRTA